MKKFYLSKNYFTINGAVNKAKTDAEKIMNRASYVPSGINRTVTSNKISNFILTFASILVTPFRLNKGNLLVIQYPHKRYYSFICNIAHLRGCKVITLIHDVRSFLSKKITVTQEIKRLEHTDYLIVHNENMRKWFEKEGFSKQMGCLEIFDYLSEASAKENEKSPEASYTVIYAGALNYTKNPFLYKIDNIINSWHFNLYGNGFEIERIKNKDSFTYSGFLPSDELITNVRGDFGLVWDGESTESCEGKFGEYLQYNNPHKTSLYIRCHLPIIIWKKAALASFVEENDIGITVNSLEELNSILPKLTFEDYQRMRKNIIKVSEKLSTGYYLQEALKKAETYLSLK